MSLSVLAYVSVRESRMELALVATSCAPWLMMLALIVAMRALRLTTPFFV